jgi:hypothetical protein
MVVRQDKWSKAWAAVQPEYKLSLGEEKNFFSIRFQNLSKING